MRKLAYIGLALVIAMAIATVTQVQARTYLGVATVPTNPEVGDHLKLQDGVGLTVVQVDPDSAAGDVLQAKDIITKLDDQILIDPRQLAILLRNRKPGDKVKLEIYRHGEKMLEEMELGKAKDLPEMQARRNWRPGPFAPPARQFHQMPPPASQEPDRNDFMEEFQQDLQERFETFRESFGDMDAMLERLREEMQSGGRQGSRIQGEQHSSVNITQIINGRRYNYTREGKDQHLEVIDKKGNVVFDGPINTEEELDKVPQDAVKFLDSIDIDVEYEPAEEVELIPSDAI